MPTTYTDQFYNFDPYSPPPVGTAVSFSTYDLVDNNDDGDLDRLNNDSINGSDIRSSYPGDTVTIDVRGVGEVTYTGTTFYLADGSRVFTPTDGQVLQDGILVSTTWVSPQGPLLVGELGPTCFTPGTRIKTDKGERLIEDLQVGDLIRTRDNGLKPILWISRRTFKAAGKEAPVLIRKGALGNDADLLVSQQHRMLITGWRAQLYLGTEEVLIAAKHLVNDHSIRIIEGGDVEYIHLLFDAHEIVTAAGIPSESYHPQHATATNDRETLAEMNLLFPDLDAGTSRQWNTARHVAKQYEAGLIAA